MIDHGSDEGSVRAHGVVADQHRTAGEHAHQGQGDGEQHHLPGLPSAAAALGHGVKVPRPLRIRRNRVDRTVEFERAVKLASRDVGEEGSTLVLLDADMDCPAQLATALARPAEAVRPDGMIRVVLAKTGFESRFLAAATSIGARRGIVGSATPPTDPEAIGDAKGVLSSWMASNGSFRTSRDQAALAAVFDLHGARSSPSFDNLWRDVKALLGAAR